MLEDRVHLGVIVRGRAGVGKSRIADHIATSHEASGRLVERVFGTGATVDVPLGAVAHILTRETVSSSALDRFASTREAIDVVRGGGAPMLVAVDDVNLLDAASVTLLVQLLSARTIELIATVRDGEVVPEAIDSLIRSQRLVEFTVADFTRDETTEFLRSVLSGPVHHSAASAMFEVTRGNLLFLREVVSSTLARSSLVQERGVWQLVSTLAVGSRLSEMISDRINEVSSDAKAVVDLIALCEPVGLALLEAEGALDAVLELEDQGLVVVVPSDHRVEVRLAHPLYGEALRENMGTLRRRQTVLAHAARIEDLGARRREDAMRLALWRLDAGVAADGAVLVAGARVARAADDMALTERLARAALGVLGVGDPTRASALALLGDALFELGSFVEADRAIGEALQIQEDALELMSLAMSGHRIRFWGLGDADGAHAILDQVMARVDERLVHDALRTGHATVDAFGGRPERAIDVIGEIESDLDLIEVAGAIPFSVALAQVGRTDEAIEVARRGRRMHLQLDDPASVGQPTLHRVTEAFALAEIGRYNDANRVASLAWGEAAVAGVPLLQVWCALMSARCLMLSGRLGDASLWAAEAEALSDAAHFPSAKRMALSLIGAIAGQRGDVARSRRAIVSLDGCPPDASFLLHETAIGRGWASSAAGRSETARTLLLAAADRSWDDGQRTSASMMWFEAVRLGATQLADRFDEADQACDGSVHALRARSTRALESDSPADLDECGDVWESCGAQLIGAEWAAAAADGWRRRGDQRSAQLSSSRSSRRSEQCDGPRTPGLARPDAVVALTGREREIAVLARDGLASKDIAERLHLSVRTVGNHLQNVYSKLGISGRSELHELL